VILSSTHFGIPLSTTQVCSGSVVGAGLGRAQPVRWVVFGRMVVTWVVTLPAAGAVGALTFAVVNGIGGDLGVIVMALALTAYCAGIWALSQRTAVNAANVNNAWDEAGGAAHEPAVAGASS
jgi:PiT family inorganic phosphate transporter